MKIKIAIPSKAKQFIRDYRLPLVASAGLIIIVSFLFVARIRERATLGQIFDVKNSGSLDYASLLSNDKSDDFVKRDVGADEPGTSSPTKQQPSNTTSTTIATSLTGSGAVLQSAGSTPSPTPTPTPTPTPVTPPTPVPFTAAISDFTQDQSPSLQCPNGLLGNINISKCSKVYSFAASIQTTGGPGSVNYNWLYSVSGSANGSFTASSGANTTTLHNQITLSCKNSVDFTAQFVLTSPAAAKSKTLQISHSC